MNKIKHILKTTHKKKRGKKYKQRGKIKRRMHPKTHDMLRASFVMLIVKKLKIFSSLIKYYYIFLYLELFFSFFLD
jgi:hypothetical protein